MIAKNIVKSQTINRFAYDVEQLYIAQKKNYRIVELPVSWHDIRGSKVNPFRDSVLMFRDLLKIRLNDIIGKYT